MNEATLDAAAELDAFLAWESRQPDRFERPDGTVRTVPARSAAHERLALNLHLGLRARLRTKSRRDVHFANLKVTARKLDAVLYPDVLVRCGPLLQRESSAEDPVVVFVVAARSGGDKGPEQQLQACRSIPSVRSIVEVAEGRPRLRVVRRSREGWIAEAIEEPGGVLELPEIRVKLPLLEIHDEISAAAVPAPK